MKKEWSHLPANRILPLTLIRPHCPPPTFYSIAIQAMAVTMQTVFWLWMHCLLRSNGSLEGLVQCSSFAGPQNRSLGPQMTLFCPPPLYEALTTPCHSPFDPPVLRSGVDRLATTWAYIAILKLDPAALDPKEQAILCECVHPHNGTKITHLPAGHYSHGPRTSGPHSQYFLLLAAAKHIASALSTNAFPRIGREDAKINSRPR